MLKKNDIIPLEITDVTGQGSGIGRADGMAVFVPMTAVGDVIDARILKVKKSYAFGKAERIVSPSALRTEPDCPFYAKCGGCVFRHISYAEELKIKRRRVYDALTRIGGLSGFGLREIVGADCPDRYRNKSQIPVGRGRDGTVEMGFFGSHSHRIVGSGECLLQPAEFDAVARAVRGWINDFSVSLYDEQTHTGLLRHLYLRKGFKSGEIMVCLVINGTKLPHSGELLRRLEDCCGSIVTVMLNINRARTNVILGSECRTLSGSGVITDELCGLSFRISPLSFYQINHDQTEKLYALAAKYAGLTGSELLIDLYCGAGTIGLSMADKTRRLIGVEVVPEAIENARENAENNGVENAEFLCMDAGQAAQELARRGERPDVVVIDPPRKGCDEAVIGAVCEMSPARVVYVSCDPETLARDLARFSERGYELTEATPVDMFPRTQHVECVVCIQKIQKKGDL